MASLNEYELRLRQYSAVFIALPSTEVSPDFVQLLPTRTAEQWAQDVSEITLVQAKVLLGADHAPTDEGLRTLWWLTETFPRSIYPYRQLFGAKPTLFHDDPGLYIKKPLGYSWHPQELAPTPTSMVAKTGNLVWHRERDHGGHFAAMELPMEFAQDIEEFIAEVWPKAKNA